MMGLCLGTQQPPTTSTVTDVTGLEKHGHGQGTAKSNPDSPAAPLLALLCGIVQPTLRKKII